MVGLLYDADGTGNFEVYLADLDGTNPVQLTSDVAFDSWFPQGAPDGAFIVCVRSAAGNHDPPPYTTSDVWRFDADGADPTLILDRVALGWVFLATPHVSPDSAQIVVARAPAAAAARPTIVDTAGTVVADLDFDAGNALTDPSWHPDPDAGGAGIARLVYCRAGSIVRRDWDGVAPVGSRSTVFDRTTWDTGDPGTVNPWCYDPRYSPDGTLVGFLAEFADQGNGDWGVGVCNDDGTSPFRVTPDDHIYSRPEWSADGAWIYCHRFNAGWEIVRVPSDGSAVATPGVVEVLVTGDYSEYPSEFTPEVVPPPGDPAGCTLLYRDSFEGRSGDLVGSDTDGIGSGDPQEWGQDWPGALPDSLVIIAGKVQFPTDYVWVLPSLNAGLLATLPVTATDHGIVAYGVTLPSAAFGDDVTDICVWLLARGGNLAGFAQINLGADGHLDLTVVRPGFPDDTDSTAAGVVADGDDLALWCIGAAITARVNGTVVALVTDPSPTAPLTAVGLLVAAYVEDDTDVATIESVDVYVCASEEPPSDDAGGSEGATPSTPPPGPCGDPPLHVAPTSAVLGPASRCAETRVEIRRRGSRAPILQLDSGDEMIERYEWNRALGATAPAQVVVPLGGSVDAACCRVLGSLTPWRDELLIYRDEDLVWQGPLHVAREVRDRVVLDARDPSAWAEVRRVRRRHTFVERDAAEAWAIVFADGLSADWPPGLELRMTRACALVTRTVEPLPYLLAAGPMGEIAADGVDWTAFGSTILVGGRCTNVILDVTLYDDAFAGSPEVAPDGAAYASWVGVNGEGDVVAEAGGIDPDIGLVERVFDDRGARDERTARQHAQRSWAVRGRDGVPVIVSMAQDVALSGRAPLGVNDLVCGRMLRVAIQPACREVATLMRLVAVKVTGDADGEKIVPTLEPVGDAGGLNG